MPKKFTRFGPVDVPRIREIDDDLMRARSLLQRVLDYPAIRRHWGYTRNLRAAAILVDGVIHDRGLDETRLAKAERLAAILAGPAPTPKPEGRGHA